jgi:hypothetical protein
VESENKYIIGGIIIVILGGFISYQTIKLHFKDIFTLIAMLIVCFGLYLLFYGALGRHNKKVTQSNILKATKSSNHLLGSKSNTNRLNSNTVKTSPSQITEKIQDIAKATIPNPNIKLPGKKTPAIDVNTGSDYVFTPNYERPSKILRRPVKKSKEESKKRSPIGKIKPTIPIDQLSKTLGMDKKEDEEIARLKKFLEEKDKDCHTTINTFKNSNLKNQEILEGIVNEDEGIKKPNDDEITDTYILCGDKTLSFNEAFEKLVKDGKEEVCIEIPTLKNLSTKFLSYLSYLDTRIILEEFDLKDVSQVLLITSLLEQNVSIRTMDHVNSTNLIVDNKYALILSKSNESNIDIGAIYNEESEVQSVKLTFELSWNLSDELKNI